MKELKDKELKKINGGFSLTAALAISAVIVFLAGVVDGFVNPKPCGGNK